MVYVAKRFTGSGLQLVDLIQEGTLGLIRAADRYDWRRGCRFSTYAMWWIRQAVQRGIHRSSGTIRLPVNVLEQVREVRTLELQLLMQFQREPTDEEVADAAGLSPAEVREISRAGAQSPLSLDEPYGETGTLADAVPAEKGVEDELDPRLNVEAVRDALSSLPGLEREVVRLRYGIGEDRPRTMDDVGSALGIAIRFGGSSGSPWAGWCGRRSSKQFADDATLSRLQRGLHTVDSRGTYVRHAGLTQKQDRHGSRLALYERRAGPQRQARPGCAGG